MYEYLITIIINIIIQLTQQNKQCNDNDKFDEFFFIKMYSIFSNPKGCLE